MNNKMKEWVTIKNSNGKIYVTVSLPPYNRVEFTNKLKVRKSDIISYLLEKKINIGKSIEDHPYVRNTDTSDNNRVWVFEQIKQKQASPKNKQKSSKKPENQAKKLDKIPEHVIIEEEKEESSSLLD